MISRVAEQAEIRLPGQVSGIPQEFPHEFSVFAAGSGLGERRSEPVDHQQIVEKLRPALEEWYSSHNYGANTVRISVEPSPGSLLWFRIRHGQTTRWIRTVNEQKTEVHPYRAEDANIIVYSRDHDEIWIRAGSRQEREICRKQCGISLHGSEDHFHCKDVLTLCPLKRQGPDALEHQGVLGISKITLRQIEMHWVHSRKAVTVFKADDLFGDYEKETVSLLSGAGDVAGVTMLMEFTDSLSPRLVEIRPPNKLRLQRLSDLTLILDWLSKKSFRRGAEEINRQRRAA